MILVPEINSQSFVFFYEKGTTGYSYSTRDYSKSHHVTERYARDYASSADEIRQKALYIYDAPYLDVKRLAEWHSYTAGLNRLHGLEETVNGGAALSEAPEAKIGHGQFPMLNVERFSSLPKAAKTGDVHRILDSPQSEDWVTWNLLNLLLKSRPDTAFRVRQNGESRRDAALTY